MTVQVVLGKDEARIIAYGLDVPASIADGLEDIFGRDVVEDRVTELQVAIAESAGRLLVETDLDREILIAAAVESTYFCDMVSEEPPVVMARFTKAANSLERKFGEAFGRTIQIPRT